MSTTENGHLSLAQRLQRVRDAMRATLYEREDAIDCVLFAAIAQEHVVLLGPPGAAKSQLLDALVASFTGVKKFSTLLTKFTTEDELCGPAKLSELKLDRFVRSTDDYLPGAHVAFLDETFKANSACLNATLTITNERRYKGQPCPLRTLVGASNEYPEEEGLGAMYDRFLLRHVVDYIGSPLLFTALLTQPPTYVAPDTFTLDEWDQITAEARAVNVPPAVVEQIVRMREKLAASGIRVSDRRWVKALSIVRAAAWLDGEREADTEHLLALRFVLWSKPDERDQVRALLRSVDLGPVQRCREIADEALKALAHRSADAEKRRDEVPQLIATISAAAKSIRAVAPQLSGKRAKERFNRILGELQAASTQLKDELSKSYEL